MCKYTCALLTFLMLVVLPVYPFQTEGGFQQITSPAAAKRAASTGDQEKPRFEVISIKLASPKPPRSGAYWRSLKFLPGCKFIAVNENLNDLISTANEIPYLQVMGIPKFIEKAFWNIEAKPEEGRYPLKAGLLDPHVGNLMIQSMLEDRFKLKSHQETRILPGYELRIAKGGLKLAPPKDQSMPFPPEGGSISETKDPAKPGGVGVMPGFIGVRNIPLSAYATRILSSTLSLNGEKSRFYVVDKTGLEGNYDIRLKWTQGSGPSIASQNQAAGDDEITIFDALQEQLGLRLVPANVSIPVIVIDDAQMPMAN